MGKKLGCRLPVGRFYVRIRELIETSDRMPHRSETSLCTLDHEITMCYIMNERLNRKRKNAATLRRQSCRHVRLSLSRLTLKLDQSIDPRSIDVQSSIHL
jgi:hypothetical protein